MSCLRIFFIHWEKLGFILVFSFIFQIDLDISIIFPPRMDMPSFEKRNILYRNMLICNLFTWNWHNESNEEDKNVNDNRAFGSGELKRKPAKISFLFFFSLLLAFVKMIYANGQGDMRNRRLLGPYKQFSFFQFAHFFL